MALKNFFQQLARDGLKERRRKPGDEEHRLQAECVNWFRARYPHMRNSLFAVPNGGRRDKTTGARLKAEGVIPGVANLILLRQSNGYGALLIKLKTATGKQSPAQKAWQKEMEANGYKYVVVRSVEEFLNEVFDYMLDF